jgi:hypothetical protein
MPRYFFRLQNGETVKDEDGEELADQEAAFAAAIEIFAETLPSQSETLVGGGEYEVMVTDADDGQVYSITAQGRRF